MWFHSEVEWNVTRVEKGSLMLDEPFKELLVVLPKMMPGLSILRFKKTSFPKA